MGSAPTNHALMHASATGCVAHLVEVEHEVQLAHVFKVVVQDLYKQVDGLYQGQLIVRDIDAHGEEQARVPPVDDLVRAVLQGQQVRWG